MRKEKLNFVLGYVFLFIMGSGMILFWGTPDDSAGALPGATAISLAPYALRSPGVLAPSAHPTRSVHDFSNSSPDLSTIPGRSASYPSESEITSEDRLVLEDLPPICTSQLPGLDLHDQQAGIAWALLGLALHEHESQGTQAVSIDDSEIQLVQHAYPLHQQAAQAETKDGAIDLAFSQLHQNSLTGYPPAYHLSKTPQVDFQTDARRLALNPHGSISKLSSDYVPQPDAADPHLEIYSRNAFPSATECATCHQQIFDQWASSSHAYSAISPMFHAFEETINKLSSGTIGYFCLRCHAPVATTMGLRRDQPIWDGPRVFREGVTCVACHRVKTIYTKSNGERRIEPGDIYAPVYGYSDGQGTELANKYSKFFNIKTNPSDLSPGQPTHQRAIQFEEIRESTFCMSCHQVAVKPGIKLEVVWDQYRASPAYQQKISCQDCHMGKIPGVDSGYSVGPAAVIDGKAVLPERRHSNHAFYGPGYSIAHPGIFPQNQAADRWTVNQWLEFDWRAGWGTEAFENGVADGVIQTWFPQVWSSADDRYDAREIIEKNFKALKFKDDLRRQVLENGSKLDGPFFNRTPQVNKNLNFYYCLTNLNSGHNMPSGSLGAQPQIWMNVVLIDPHGNRIWETGYLDGNGDLADRHSLEVAAGRIRYDSQLMNLQTRFLTTNVKGTDREMYIPFNLDIDQLPFIRPAPQPTTVLNHPPFIRMEAHSLAPLGSRNIKYSLPAKLIQTPGTYRLSVRLRSRAEPIYFMRFCNATDEMIRRMNEGIADFHIQSVVFEVQ